MTHFHAQDFRVPRIHLTSILWRSYFVSMKDLVSSTQWNVLQKTLCYISDARTGSRRAIQLLETWFSLTTTINHFLLELWVVLSCYTWGFLWSIFSNTCTHAWGDTALCPGPGQGAIHARPEQAWGLWNAQLRGGELRGSMLWRWITRQGRPPDGFVSMAGIDRTGKARSHVRWDCTENGRNCLNPTGVFIRCLQALQMKAGWSPLKLLTQYGHSLCSFWGSEFFLFPLCGHVPLLSSLMTDFPPFPPCGAMENGSLEIILIFFFFCERAPAALSWPAVLRTQTTLTLHGPQLMKVCPLVSLLQPQPSPRVPCPDLFHTHSGLLMLLPFPVSDHVSPLRPQYYLSSYKLGFVPWLWFSFSWLSLPPAVDSQPGQPSSRECPLAKLLWSLYQGVLWSLLSGLSPAEEFFSLSH